MVKYSLNYMARAAALVALTLAAATPVMAEVVVTDLDPQPVEGVPSGKMAIVEGTTDKEGDRFNVPGLSYFQPASVTLVADRRGDDIRLKLGKFDWNEDYMGGGTGRDGYYIAKFNTQGDLLISVSADQPETPYRLIVWTGEEQTPQFKPVLVPPSEADAGFPKWLLIGLGALAAIGAAFYLGRRGKGVKQ